MNFTTEEKILILGSLFHDVGKIVQRCVTKKLENHQKEGAKLVGDFKETFENIFNKEEGAFDRFTKIILEHHNKNIDDELVKIVQTADRLSASERVDFEEKDEADHTWSNNFLVSLTSKIKLTSEKETYPGLFKHQLLIKKNYDAILPEEISQEEASKLGFKYNDGILQSFCNDLKIVLEHYKQEEENSFESLINNILVVFEKYLWCIPDFKGNESTDISLYNHSKDVCGISLALFKADKNKSNDLCLIVGDIPGIQNYIFDIINKKPAKILRGRSIFIQVLTRALVTKFINKLGLTEANIVMLAGGKFYILSHNTLNILEVLNELKSEIEKFLFEQLDFTLQFSFGISGFNAKDYININITFGDIIENANIDLQNRRENSLLDYVIVSDKNKNLIKDIQFLDNATNESDNILCDLTGKPLAKSNVEKIPKYGEEDPIQCSKQSKLEYKIGEKNVDQNSIILLDQNFFPTDVKNIKELSADDKNSNKILINPDLDSILSEKEKSDIFLNNSRYLEVANVCTKNENNSVLDFESMSKCNDGAQFLSLIKGDIDNLGLIMAFGLTEDNKNKNLEALSRTTTLSNLLKYYFSFFINGLFKDSTKFRQKVTEDEIKNETPNIDNLVYTVFAGGDDLMLICPQSYSLKLLQHFNNSFEKFTCSNPEIHISYSVTHFKHNTPIKIVSEFSEKNQEKAKKYFKNKLESKEDLAKNYFNKSNDKNGLYIFETVIKMENLETLLQKTEKLYSWGKGEENGSPKLSIGIIRNLMILSEMINKYRESKGKETKYLMWHPLLSYLIKRNVIKKDKYPSEEIQKFFEEFLKLTKNNNEINNFEKLIYPAVCGAIYKLRRTK